MISRINWLLKRLQRICYCTFLAAMTKIKKSHSISSDKIYLWINPGFSFRHFAAYWGNNTFVWDVARWINLNRMGYNVKLVFGKNIGKLKNSKVIIPCGKQSNFFSFINYYESLDFIARQLEAQGNTLYPSRSELMFWENKSYMYKEFARLNLSFPKTLISSYQRVGENAKSIGFPLIVKEEHSCSSNGIFLIKSEMELDALTRKKTFVTNNANVILQEFVDIRRDLRVVVVGSELVLHYWRINRGKTWQPTATGRGNSVDFEFFPDMWKKWIIDVTAQLGLSSAAFDIAWRNDDVTNIPLILEVSPSFEPNPRVTDPSICDNYGIYKKSFSFFKSYDIEFVNISNSIQRKWLNQVLG
jgi:glutathione synthase/RimK-type ligase-like ATP-grasp enzyme